MYHTQYFFVIAMQILRWDIAHTHTHTHTRIQNYKRTENNTDVHPIRFPVKMWYHVRSLIAQSSQ